MSINLTWRSFQGSAPLQQQNISLTNDGGTLGRATDNQFIIYDPEQFASRYHARIFVEQGLWYIEDTSSTGTLINDNIELFNGQSHQLRHGDILSIGECDIELQIVHQPSVQAEPLTEPQAAAVVNQPPTASGSFNIDDFFNDGSAPAPIQQAAPQAEPEAKQVQRTNMPYMSTSDAILPPEPIANDNNEITDDAIDAIDDAFDLDSLFSSQSEVPQQQQPQPEEADNIQLPEAEPVVQTPIVQAPAEKPTLNDDTIALRAFLSELNINPQELIGQNKADVMRVAGVILRTLTQGMMEVLQARSSVKTHFQMDTTQIQSARNNPLKFSTDSTEAMAHMLKQEKGYMDPIESAEEAVNDAKAHQMAMVSGLDAAIAATISAFDPEQLEKEFDQDSGFTFSKKSKYWQHFHEKFKQIADEAESTSNSQFSQQFRQHYEAQIRQFYAEKFK